MAARMVTWSLDMVSKMYRMIFLYQQIQGPGNWQHDWNALADDLINSE